MTDLIEHRAWVRAVTRISDARNIMDNVQFLGLDPDIRKECEEIWNRLDELSGRMMARIKEMEMEPDPKQMLEDNLRMLRERE